MNYYDENLYLFGGSIDKNTFSNELWKYSINENIWYNIVTGYDTPTCSGHRMVTFKNYLILFGGYTMINKKWMCYNNIYIYDCDKKMWNKIECNNKPLARYQHAMCIVNNNLIINGGLDINDKQLNDMYSISINNIINNNSPEWIKINNNIPPLFGHLMLFNEHKLYFFGGKNKSNGHYISNHGLLIYDDNNFNTTAICKTDGANRRCSHNGCIIHLNGKDYIFIFGGFNERRTFHEAILIYIQQSTSNDTNKAQSNIMTPKCNDDVKTIEMKYKNEINELKTEINRLNQRIQNEYETKIRFLLERINNEHKRSELKTSDELNKKEVAFKQYFANTFKHIKSNKIYYNNLIKNEITGIDSLILMDGISDINEYIKPKNKIHANLFLKRINQIKNDRNEFEEILKMINMFGYLDNFDEHGIYTLKEYNDKIININDLKWIIKNNKACITIYNSINNEYNEGQQINPYI